MISRYILTIILLVVVLVILPASSAQELLPASRTIEFTTDEGTWMSVDVSPDGKQIVFDMLGDLFLLPIAGGEARTLTSGPAWDTQPRFSPDGKSIAFVSDRSGSDNLWLVETKSGEAHALTHEKTLVVGSPSWSPDGNWIVVRKGYGGLMFHEVWRYPIESGEGEQLFKRDGFNSVAGPVFSPGGKEVWFSLRTVDSPPFLTLEVSRFQLRRFDLKTREVEAIMRSYGGAARPQFSPDGRLLAYGSRREGRTGLRLRDLRTGGEQWIAYPIDYDRQEYLSGDDLLPGYGFTPDGNSIIIAHGGKIHRIDLTTKEQTFIPFTAKVRQQVIERTQFKRRIDDGPVKVRQSRNANQSPDGNRLVFSAIGKVWLMDLPSGKPVRLTQNQSREFCPVFSPDGRWIAYVSWSDDGGGHLWKAPVDGGQPIRLSRVPAFYHNPSWSKDGGKIVFVTGSTRAWMLRDYQSRQEIRWIAADGGESHLIVNSPLSAPGSLDTPPQHPLFSEDGERVWYLDYQLPSPFYHYSNATLTLRSARLDGSDRKEHVKLSAPFVREAVPSPDGEWVAWTSQVNVFLSPLPNSEKSETITLEPNASNIRQLTTEGGQDLRWLNGGKSLTWSFANTFSRAGSPSFKPDEFTIDLQTPRRLANGKIAFLNARIITMRGNEVIERGDLVIENNRIVALGAAGKVKIPADSTIIKAEGKTIMPGLIDMHAHPGPRQEIFPQKYDTFAAHLAYGITTAFDPDGFDNNAIFGAAELIEAGELTGPRYFSTGVSLRPSTNRIESLDDARQIARRYKRSGAIALKEYLQNRRDQRQWLAMAAREEGLNTTAEGAGYFAGQMTHVLDGYTGFEHWIGVAPIYKDVIELMAQCRTCYDPTLGVAQDSVPGQYYIRQSFDLRSEARLRRFANPDIVERFSQRIIKAPDEEFQFRRTVEGGAAIARSGGSLVVGGHENKGLPTHWEMWLYVQGGMTPMESLRAATIEGAKCLGMEADLGSLEPGKVADLLVLNLNPLDNIRHSKDILYVMKNGELYDSETLDQIWPQKKQFGKFFWQQENESLEKVRLDRKRK